MKELKDNEIKCGRNIFKLADGDTIMDNGCSLQLTTRRTGRCLYGYPPEVSIKEFEKFKKNPNVTSKKRSDAEHITLWIYSEKPQ